MDAESDIGAIVPLTHKLAGQQHLNINKLRGERLILFGNAAMIRDRLLAQTGPLVSQLEVVHEVGDGRMLRALASRDLGVGIGPISAWGKTIANCCSYRFSQPFT